MQEKRRKFCGNTLKYYPREVNEPVFGKEKAVFGAGESLFKNWYCKKKNSGLSFSYTLRAVPLLEFLSLLETCPKTDRDGLKEF